MPNKLVNFALAKSIYSEKKNYLDTFSPFVLKVIFENAKTLTISQVDDFIRKEYDLKIPIYTLKSILSMLANEKLINLDKSKKEYSSRILERGNKFANDYIESEKNIKRKLQKFWREFTSFAQNKYSAQYESNIDEVKVSKYINENIIELIEYAFGDGDEMSIRKENTDFAKHFSHFICDIENSSVELYDIFQEILKGYILWNEIANKENVEKEADFNNLIVYLDSNYLISLLELDSPFSVKSAKQLYDLLRRNNKIILKVLTTTLDEIKRLLIEYKRRKNNYYDIPVNDVYYFLHINQYDDAKIDLFISNLASKCDQYGITIEPANNLDHLKLKEIDKKLFDTLYKSNMDLNAKDKVSPKREETIFLSTLHDVTAVHFIRNKRGNWTQNLENSKAVFLTSSSRLDRILKEQVKTDTFPETILDVTMTNILWLKNPENDVGCSVQQIIAIHAKNIFVNHSMWKRFISTVQELKDEEKINDKEYAYLISNNQTTKEFLKNNKVNDITHQKVLQLLNEILAEDAIDKEELKARKKKIEQQAKEINFVKNHIAKLQSKFDKTNDALQKNVDEKEQILNKINSLQEKLEAKETQEKKIITINSKVEKELSRLIKEAKKLLLYFIVSIIIYVLVYLLTDDVFKLPKWISMLIIAVLLVISTVVLNKVSNKEFLIVSKRVTSKRTLEKSLRTKFENEHDVAS